MADPQTPAVILLRAAAALEEAAECQQRVAVATEQMAAGQSKVVAALEAMIAALQSATPVPAGDQADESLGDGTDDPEIRRLVREIGG